MPRTRSVKPATCRSRGVPRSSNGRGGWVWVFVDGFRCEGPVAGLDVTAAGVLAGCGEVLGVRIPVACWSAEIAFWAVAVAVIADPDGDDLCCDDAAGALVAVEAPPPCGSVGRIPDRRKTSPITAAIVLATRNDRWT